MSAQQRPMRLHHTAFVTRDQERTRAFYEDLVGLPLIATWAEQEELFGSERTYCHTFFGLEDGSALAFFQFADPADDAEFGPEIPKSPFNHIALNVRSETQNAIHERLVAAAYDDDLYILEHGYCRSLYVRDPNGLLLEFTADAPDAIADAPRKARLAHEELKRWLSGDHTPNNKARGEHVA